MEQNNLSSIAGTLSIACWLIVFTPQLWKNYVNKSGEGLSMSFLVIWLAGDIFNLLGVIIQDLLVTMFLLALYYTVADMGLIWQVIHYQKSKQITEEQQSSETSLLLAQARTNLPSTYLLPDNGNKKESKKLLAFNVLSCLSILLVLIASSYVYFSLHEQERKDEKETEWLLVPQLMGWASAILYIGSRIPQILKNKQKKSTDGLSVTMFICAVMGNILFTMSILLKSTERNYILVNLPWIVGSLGTLLLDSTIFIQFFLYGEEH